MALIDETPPARLWTHPPADSKTRGSSCGSEVTAPIQSGLTLGFISTLLFTKPVKIVRLH